MLPDRWRVASLSAPAAATPPTSSHHWRALTNFGSSSGIRWDKLFSLGRNFVVLFSWSVIFQ